jgi:hypothetical protein
MSTGSEAAASFEELNKAREIQSGWRSHEHMNVRLQNGELNDLNIMTCRSLLEELLQECSRRRVDHGHPIERRPREMNEELMR